MKYQVKITVLKRGYDQELADRFLVDPNAGKCSIFNEGQEFIVTKENYERFPYENDFCAADGLIVGSPVYFVGPNGALCALLDRVFYATCTYAQIFQGKAAAAVVSCAWAGGTAAFDRLHRYFVPCQMPIINSGDYTVFQGDSVKRREGRSLQLLRELADNMARQLRHGSNEQGGNREI